MNNKNKFKKKKTRGLKKDSKKKTNLGSFNDNNGQ